jgi:tripartite-type tricarboxylate transporter receptor subunit TctC
MLGIAAFAALMACATTAAAPEWPTRTITVV